MATITWHGGTGSFDDWFDASLWTPQEVPGAGDTAVIAAVGEPVFDGTDTVQSVDIEPDAAFAIAEGQFTVTEGLTIGAGGGFKIANSGLTTGESISVAIDGALTNSGSFVSDRLSTGPTITSTVTIGAFDNESSGVGDFASAVTITTMNNAGGRAGVFGIDTNTITEDSGFDETGGDVTVTGTLSNTGWFVIGNDGTEAAPSLSARLSVGTLDNEATGRISIRNATVTVQNVDNAGVDFSGTIAGFFVDSDNSGSDSILKVTGTFDNTGKLEIGSAGATTSVDVGTFEDETNGVVDIYGGTVTIHNIDNTAGSVAGSTGVFGVDSVAGQSGGNLTVTGAFTNAGMLTIGNAASTTTVSIQTLDDEVNGSVNVVAGQVTVASLTNQGVITNANANAGLSVGTGAEFTITGALVNSGNISIGAGGGSGSAAVTAASLNNESDGVFDIDTGVVTIGEVTNALSSKGAPNVNFGVDAGDDTSGGELKVTGTFTNDGYVQIGTLVGGDVPSATTVTILTLANTFTGGVNVLAGTLTVTNLSNSGANTTGSPQAGLGVDQLPGEFGGNLTVTNTLTNTGDFTIGNSGLKQSAFAKVGTLVNVGGSVSITAGTAVASDAELDLTKAPATWNGALSLDGGTTGILGQALLELGDNGQISTIGANSSISIDGALAFVADADAATANSALQGLTTINGTLDLELGAEVAVKGNLTNNGGSTLQTGIAIDVEETAAESSLTVQKTLTNNEAISIGNLKANDDEDETALSVGALDNSASGGVGIIGVAAAVTGDLTNAGVVTGKGIGVDIVQGAEGGSLTVGGAATNSGDLGIGNSGDDGSTKASFNSLQNAATGSIAIVNAKVAVTDGLTNLGGGANGGIVDGIGVDLANGGSGSLTVGGLLTNSGDIGIGNASHNQSTFASFGSLDNTSTGSLGIEGAGVTVTGAAQNAGVGAANGFDDGISVDTVNGTSQGDFDVSGTFTNTGVFAAGNLDDQLSTLVTFGALVNGAGGSMQLIDAEATVSGTASNAGTGKGHGIFVGGQTGSDQTSLDVIGAFTNTGELVVGNGLGTASVTASGFTNTGAVEIDLAASIVLQTNTVYTQSGGAGSTTDVAGALTAFQVNLTGGVLEGDGTIASLVSNTGGNLLAGSGATTPGELTIGGTAPGSYSQGAKGKMTELIAGAAAGQSGEVKVSGKVSLAGSLVIQAVSGFAFAAGQTFEIMSLAANGLTGLFSAIDFGSVVGNAHDALIGKGLALVVNYESKQGQVDLDVVDTTVSTKTFASEESILNQITQGFDIQDTAANIAAYFTALAADAAHIDAVALIGSGTHTLDLTEAEFTSGGALLKKTAAPYVLNVADGSTTTTGFGNDLTIAAAATGNDTLTAAGSGETFVFDATIGQDVITDFGAHDSGAGHDVIDLPVGAFETFGLLLDAASNGSNGVVIDLSKQSSLTLDGLTKSELSSLAGDFHL